MACLEMYNQNSEHKAVGGAPPRISFSNDFVESSRAAAHSHHQQIRNAYRDAPVSSDFEFSVSNHSMITADELFFKGRLLPLKESCSTSSLQKTTTLRDELRNGEGEEEDDEEQDSANFSLRPPKNPTRWRGFLGLRKSHIGSKKSDKRTHHDDARCSKNSSQEIVD